MVRSGVEPAQPITARGSVAPSAAAGAAKSQARGDMDMPYTLDRFAADCRAALSKNPGPAGRDLVRQYTEMACSDSDFVAKYLGPDATAERNVLYEDPDFHFCICAHVYRGGKNSSPHDHGPSWAVYGQVAGVTEMTDWRLVQKPESGNPGKVEKARVYALTPGHAHLYNEGDVHSPRRESDTRLIRIEGVNLMKVTQRPKYEIAA
jgi:predicted metal-dependent enzyme (double-stranded beta helix superfamily)